MRPDNFSRPERDVSKTHSDSSDTTVSPQRAFAREKFIWLGQVRADPELTPLAFLVAYTLANLVNEQKGCAWPSIAHLASECRVTARGVQKVIRRLVERGHLVVDAAIGRGRTNRYRWRLWPGEAPDQPASCPGRSKESQAAPAKGRTAVHSFEVEKVNHGSEKGEQRFQKRRTTVHPTLFNESIYDFSYRCSAKRAPPSVPFGFEDFWRAYPKKVARGDALRSFARAIQYAPAAEIIRGAIGYAAERQEKDPRFTKHPATWLNKGCWSDEGPVSPELTWDGPPSGRINCSIATRMHSDEDFEDVLTRIQQRHKQE
jgi:Helix-turn-helix domain